MTCLRWMQAAQQSAQHPQVKGALLRQQQQYPRPQQANEPEQ